MSESIRYPENFDAFCEENGIEVRSYEGDLARDYNIDMLRDLGIDEYDAYDIFKLITQFIKTPIVIDVSPLDSHKKRSDFRNKIAGTYGPEAREFLENNALRSNRIFGPRTAIDTLDTSLQQHPNHVNVFVVLQREIQSCLSIFTLLDVNKHGRHRIWLVERLKEHLHCILHALCYKPGDIEAKIIQSRQKHQTNLSD